ncbi:hypothetical protein D3C77_176050 [compost metagenome]
MDRQQQALLPLNVFDQQRPQQWTVAQVQAALHIAVQRLAIGKTVDRHLPEQLAAFTLDVITLPLALLRAKAQAQRVVMLDQLLQGLLQRLGRQTLDRRQQYRLVPVLGLRYIAVEEPVLDRRQRRATAQWPLIDRVVVAAAHHTGQGLDGLVLEQVARSEMQPRLTRTTDHLDRQDRVTAQFEEVVLQADPRHVQHIAPEVGQLLFQHAARCFIVLTPVLQIRRRQGTAVKLAIAHQWHLLQQYQMAGHHVVRQVQSKLGLQCITQRSLHSAIGLSLSADQVADQLFAARHVQGLHDCLANRRMLQQARLDFPQFDTETTNLHLMVDSANVLDQPIGALTHQVAGTVQAPALSTERVGDKAFGTEPRPLMVTLGQTGAADIQLADTALG